MYVTHGLYGSAAHWQHIMCSAGHVGHYAYAEETVICLDARNIWCGQSFAIPGKEEL